ncbi:hypothetical protein B484DRAFT_241690 [Ochromonadaceae sp. CCMP2298]|nr:hypothetical protein B484DRAFT_241690 [Ochromonadaceae sp. CCMP2298]
MWNHDYEVEADARALEDGANLLYLSSGESSYNYETALDVAGSFNVTTDRLFCFDVRKESEEVIKGAILGAANGEAPVMTVLQGLEGLPGSQRRKLNFAFRLTDSTSEYYNSVVFFAHERHAVDTDAPDADADADADGESTRESTRRTALRLKEVLAGQLDDQEVNFNGLAFIGRMARTALQEGESFAAPVDICARLETYRLATSTLTATASKGRAAPAMTQSEPDTFVPVLFMAALVVLVLSIWRAFIPSVPKGVAPTVPTAAATAAAAVSTAAAAVSTAAAAVSTAAAAATPSNQGKVTWKEGLTSPGATVEAAGRSRTASKAKAPVSEKSTRIGTSSKSTSRSSTAPTAEASVGESLRRSARQASKASNDS